MLALDEIMEAAKRQFEEAQMVTAPAPRPPQQYRQCIVCRQLVLLDFDAHCGPCPASSDGQRAHVLFLSKASHANLLARSQ